MADYWNHQYRLNSIGWDATTHIVVAIYECLFLHEKDGSQVL